MKTLVVILGETRASELTFDNIKKNVIDELNADLCLCIGVTKNYNYNNKFYKLSKYRFLYNEPDDYGTAFDFAYQEICKKNKCFYPHWRKFLDIKDQFLGGIKDELNGHHKKAELFCDFGVKNTMHISREHPGSAGILIFFRWFLLQKILENNLLQLYDRFIITRSDYIWLLPHPKIELLLDFNIWIPNCEDYGGVTDRHVILSKTNIISYLNILEKFITKSNEYYDKLKIKNNWNLEKIIKFHLYQEESFHKVQFFPYVMYTVRPINGTTRWSFGTFSEKHQYYIKYNSEYVISNNYKIKFDKYKNNIFYKMYYLFFRKNIRINQFYIDEIFSINDLDRIKIFAKNSNAHIKKRNISTLYQILWGTNSSNHNFITDNDDNITTLL